VNLGTRARTYLAAEALLLMNLPNCGHEIPLESVAYFPRPVSLMH